MIKKMPQHEFEDVLQDYEEYFHIAMLEGKPEIEIEVVQLI